MRFRTLEKLLRVAVCKEIVFGKYPITLEFYQKPISKWGEGRWHIQVRRVMPHQPHNSVWHDIAYPHSDKKRAWNNARAAVEGSSLYGVAYRTTNIQA